MTSRQSGTYFELDPAWADPGWTRMPNSIVRCTTISRRLKGWMLECASHEPGRRLTFKDMLGTSTDGRDATYATIKEGVDSGFVTRTQERDESGRMGIVVYRLHVTQQNPRSEPLPGSPDTGNPDTAEPEPENPETSKKTRSSLEDQKDLKEQDLKPSVNAAASRSATRSSSGVQAGCPTPEPQVPQQPTTIPVGTQDSADDLGGGVLFGESDTPPGRRRKSPAASDLLFEEFWDAYAHKVGKGDARKAWATATKTADPREIINAAARYAKSRVGEDPRYTPHASTWLNGERWLDEPEYARNGHVTNGDRRSTQVGGGVRDFVSPPDQSVYDEAW
jgi:hypothetical protein